MSRDFKTSSHLSIKKPSASSVTLSLTQAGAGATFSSLSDPSEARYWNHAFGLGHSYSSSRSKYSHARSLVLQPPSHAVVSQLVFGPPALGRTGPLAVVSGPRVCLYTAGLTRVLQTSQNQNDSSLVSSSIQPDRTISVGGHPALCASFRSDGRLVAIGNDRGEVRVCDATSRATLCTFRDRPANAATSSNSNTSSSSGDKDGLAVRTVAWLRNGKQLVSAGDDAILRVWSLSTSTGSDDNHDIVDAFRGHGDSIRCMVLYQPRNNNTTATDWKDLCMTGSYDQTIRIWNLENNAASNEGRCLGVLMHGAPVEALSMLPNSDASRPHWLLSVGGTIVKVWNPLTGICVCTLQTQHSKTITSLMSMTKGSGVDGDTSLSNLSYRVLTAALDGLVRIHSFNSKSGQVQHLHGVQLKDPITSLSMSEKMDRLAIGTTTGIVLVRQRGPSVSQRKRPREPRAGTYAYFTRGMNASASNSDYVLESQDRKRKLTPFDMALKQFRYGDALDEALDTRQPQAVVAVLEELGKRRGLTVALSNRDEETLEPILSFTVRYITRPQYSSLLIGVAHKLCDIHGGIAGQSETIDELFGKLKNQVYNECQTQKSLLRIVGQLDAILAAAEMEENQT